MSAREHIPRNENDSVQNAANCAMPSRPQYVVFAGVNGAGKTTLYQSGFWRRDEADNALARVNPDEILKAAKANPDSIKSQLEAGRKAVDLVERYFEKRVSFNQETTLTGQSALARLKRAHELGYEVRLHYVGVETPDVAIERVRHRADLGGHFIKEKDVRRRFESSLLNFAQCLDFCDEVRVYDNTEELTRIAVWKRGTLCWWSGHKAASSWLLRAMTSEEWRKSDERPRANKGTIPQDRDQR